MSFIGPRPRRRTSTVIGVLRRRARRAVFAQEPHQLEGGRFNRPAAVDLPDFVEKEKWYRHCLLPKRPMRRRRGRYTPRARGQKAPLFEQRGFEPRTVTAPRTFCFGRPLRAHGMAWAHPPFPCPCRFSPPTLGSAPWAASAAHGGSCPKISCRQRFAGSSAPGQLSGPTLLLQFHPHFPSRPCGCARRAGIRISRPGRCSAAWSTKS